MSAHKSLLTTRACGPSRKAHFRIGAIAIGRNGDLLGLTARHVLFSDPDAHILDADTAEQIGTRIDWPPAAHGNGNFFETIAAFRLEVDPARALMAVHDTLIHAYCEADRLPGQRVSRIGLAGRKQHAEVVSVGGAIRFSNPYEPETRILRDVVELRFVDHGADPGAPGEAGALVVDKTDAAVGLMMSKDNRRYFVAPLAPFMRAHRLILAPAVGDDLQFEVPELAADARQAIAGGLQMKRDLGAEKGAQNSRDTPVPDRLLKTLHTVHEE